MEEIVQYVLLAIVVMLVYKKPECLKALVKNKVLLIGLILLNVHLTVTYGVSCGILGSVIIIMLMDSDGYEYKEAFNPKLEVWKPDKFTQACVNSFGFQISNFGLKASLYSYPSSSINIIIITEPNTPEDTPYVTVK